MSQTSASIRAAGRAKERDAEWKVRESEWEVCKARGRCHEHSEARWRLQGPWPDEACVRAEAMFRRASRSRIAAATASFITRRKTEQLRSDFARHVIRCWSETACDQKDVAARKGIEQRPRESPLRPGWSSVSRFADPAGKVPDRNRRGECLSRCQAATRCQY